MSVWSCRILAWRQRCQLIPRGPCNEDNRHCHIVSLCSCIRIILIPNDVCLVLQDPGMAAALHIDPPRPLNEDRRQACLDGCGVLDTAAEPRFDDITNLVCSIFRLPIAIVSLVDRERQWFKSVVGLACSSTERSASFCAWTLLPAQPEVLVVPDATEDVRSAPPRIPLTERSVHAFCQQGS